MPTDRIFLFMKWDNPARTPLAERKVPYMINDAPRDTNYYYWLIFPRRGRNKPDCLCTCACGVGESQKLAVGDDDQPGARTKHLTALALGSKERLPFACDYYESTTYARGTNVGTRSRATASYGRSSWSKFATDRDCHRRPGWPVQFDNCYASARTAGAATATCQRFSRPTTASNASKSKSIHDRCILKLRIWYDRYLVTTGQQVSKESTCHPVEKRQLKKKDILLRPNPQINLGPIDMSCSFLVTDARQYDCPIVYCSPNFETLTGYRNSEILGRNCRFLQAPDGQVTGGSRRQYTDNLAVYHLKSYLLQCKEHQASIINYRKGGQVGCTPFLLSSV